MAPLNHSCGAVPSVPGTNVRPSSALNQCRVRRAAAGDLNRFGPHNAARRFGPGGPVRRHRERLEAAVYK